MAVKNENKLMTLACNEEIKTIINQPNFIEKHPYHGNSIKKNLKKGSDRSELIAAIITNQILHNQMFSSESREVSLDKDAKREVLAYLTHSDLTSLNKAACRA